MNIPRIEALDLDQIPRATLSRYWLTIAENGMGQPLALPVLIARGSAPGPVVGITAAVHGDEINGTLAVPRILHSIDPTKLKGTVIGVPVVNIPGFLNYDRRYSDDIDLNRIMPGKEAGSESEVYAHRLVERLCAPLDILIDLHTASFGRINCHYVRADLADEQVAQFARLQNADIILNCAGEGGGKLRPALGNRSVTALTIELGDPQVHQPEMIERALTGIRNILVYKRMLPGTVVLPTQPPVECAASRWLYTDRGGLLEVLPQLAETVHDGQTIARLLDPFGDVITTYTAPENGIVIGKSTNPVNPTGGRILHLGTF